jgi:peptidoglycan/LPS O-acetylase OafA/YrhL
MAILRLLQPSSRLRGVAEQHQVKGSRRIGRAEGGESSAAAVMAKPPRRADIQGLRALAILLVVAYHADLPIAGGYLGVDIFFAISGFVITAMLAAELAETGSIRLQHFYARRVRRLLPALALMLFVVALAGALLSPAVTQETTAGTGIAASLFSANIYLLGLGSGYFEPAATLNPLLHTWTLAVEEQFYLLFPLLLLGGWAYAARRALSHRRGAVFALLALVSLASFLLAVQMSSGADPARPDELAFYASPARAWEFGAGALVALAIPWLAGLSAFTARWLGLAGLAAIGLAVFQVRSVWGLSGTDAVLPIMGTCALLAGGVGAARGLSRLLSMRPVTWIGDLSYSWYLWHWPLIVFATAIWSPSLAPAAALLALLPAWLSFRFVENPIRFGPRFRGKRSARLAFVCVLIPIAASGGLLGMQQAMASTPTMQTWERSQLLHADVRRGCDFPVPLGDRANRRCTWIVPAARGNIVLIGDSSAGQFTEPVVKAGARARLNVTVATFSGCPLVTLRIPGMPEASRCLEFANETIAALVRTRPNLVIAAARSPLYIEDSAPTLEDAHGRVARSPDEKARLWQLGLEEIIRRLSSEGIPLVLVHPVPEFPKAAQSCTTIRILTNGCSTAVSREEARSRLARAKAAEQAALAVSPRAWALDFEHAVCEGDRCSTSRDGTILYRDGSHLSVDGAIRLADEFYRAISLRART